MLLQSPKNYGRIINNLVGIQGVSAGGQATINMPVNQRIHRLNFQCTGIAWLTPTVTLPASAGAGTGAILTPTIVSGNITAVAITAAGSGYTAGTYTAVVSDNVYGTNLFSANIQVTVTAGAVSAVSVVSGGVVSPVPPERFFTAVKHLVNGTIIRDISAADVLAIAAFNNCGSANVLSARAGTFGLATVAAGASPTANPKWQNLGNVAASQKPLPNVMGQFPVYFTEPWRRIVSHDSASSWDLYGQSTYQITLGITAGITSPGLVGLYEFDYLRNQTFAKDSKGKSVQSYFLKPVKQHAFTFNVPTGKYPITTLPTTYPIQRLFFYGPSQPYQIEIDQDGNKILEGTAEQVMQQYRDYGFNTDVYDIAYLSDPDQRFDRALKVQQNLTIYVWNTTAAALTVVMESTPPAFV